MRPNKVPVRAETSENVYHRSMPGVKNYHPEECLFLYLSCPICNSPPKKKTRCSQRFSQQVTIPVGWFSSSQLLIGLIGDLLERMKWNACARARRIKWIVEIWWGMIVLYNSYSQTLMLCWDNFASYSSAPIYSIHTYIYIASMFAMFMIPGSKIDIHQTIPTLNGFLRFPTSMREV